MNTPPTAEQIARGYQAAHHAVNDDRLTDDARAILVLGALASNDAGVFTERDVKEPSTLTCWIAAALLNVAIMVRDNQ